MGVFAVSVDTVEYEDELDAGGTREAVCPEVC